MKRKAVLDKLTAQAKKRGVSYRVDELTRHTGVTIDGFRSTLSRHAEIDDITACKSWEQYAGVFGKGWWRS